MMVVMVIGEKPDGGRGTGRALAAAAAAAE